MAKKPGLYRAKNGAYYRIGKNGRARFCAAPKGKAKRKRRKGGGIGLGRAAHQLNRGVGNVNRAVNRGIDNAVNTVGSWLH